jgi:uncharacterized protein (DUF2141 family)
MQLLNNKLSGCLSIFLLSMLFNCMVCTGQVPQEKGDVVVYVSNIKNSRGNVKAALFKGVESYESKKATPVAKARAFIQNGKAVITFKDIPYGEYTVKVFHDENDDVKVNTNWMGIPTEGFGISNNAIGTFGPQSYDKAKFFLKQSSVNQYIRLKYY